MAELGQVNIRRAYGNFAKDNLSRWDKITNKFGIRPQQQFDISKGKNATDMAMTIDAIDLLYQGKVDGFGIMTSDSDFTPLVTRLRQDGILVYGFGEKKTPEAFQSVCTRFLLHRRTDCQHEGRGTSDKAGVHGANGRPQRSDPRCLPPRQSAMTRALQDCIRSARSQATGRASMCAITASRAFRNCSIRSAISKLSDAPTTRSG